MTQTVNIVMGPAERAALQQVGDRLDALLTASDNFVGEAIAPPVPGSPIDTAFEAQLRDPYEQAHALIFPAEQHLHGILSIITNTARAVPNFAPYTLIRAAADADVRARHLLAPEISETVRLARGLNERLDNLIEQRKLDSDNTHFASRVAALEKKATANGIQTLYSSPGPGGTPKVTGFAEQVPSELELFSKYLVAGSTAFRYLSGYVHSKPWVTFPRKNALPSDDPDVSIVFSQLDVVDFAAVLNAVLDVHDDVIRLWLAAAGYPAMVWIEAKKGSGTSSRRRASSAE